MKKLSPWGNYHTKWYPGDSPGSLSAPVVGLEVETPVPKG